MKKVKVLGLVGGISKDSLNKKLFYAFQSETPSNFELLNFKIEDLPYFSQDLEKDVPDVVKEFRELVKSADAILFVTPEYNRSIPGVLKNAIDWASRPYGKSVWDKKTAAVVGASMGNIGTFGAQHHLRQCLSYLNMRTMGQPEFYLNASKSFDETGKLIDKNVQELIQKFWISFKEWIQFNKNQFGMQIAFNPSKRRIIMAQKAHEKLVSSSRPSTSKSGKGRSSSRSSQAVPTKNTKSSQMTERSSK